MGWRRQRRPRIVDRQIINLGSGTDVSINALVDKIGRVTGRKVAPLLSGAQKGGVSRLCADVGKARRLLNFTPKVDLDTGLHWTLERDPRFKSCREDNDFPANVRQHTGRDSAARPAKQ